VNWEKLAQRYAVKMYRKRMRALAETLKNVEEVVDEDDKDKELKEEVEERNYYKRWRGGFST
jgi:hypothetical protein